MSEIMLQQTQVTRKEKFPLFIRTYPTVRSLANASKAEVIKSWQGMGYNNRVLRLKESAQIITEKYKGKFPATVEELLDLPGVGKYTAHAFLCFALKQNVAVVDVNVVRVFSRFFFPMNNAAEMKSEKEIWQFAEAILPKKRAYEWNQALMDFGATVCTARQPQCSICALRNECRSRDLFSRKEVQIEKQQHEKKVLRISARYHRGKIIEMFCKRDEYISIEQMTAQVFSKSSSQKYALYTFSLMH